MSLTFYTHPQSRGRIARWMLEEVGQPYETVVLDYATTMKAEPYLNLNLMGKVPTLVHDGAVVTEVAAIITYLAQTFPEAGLMPKDIAAYYRWMFFAAGPVEQAVVNTSLGWIPAPGQQSRTGYGSLERVVDTLTLHFAHHDFVCGDSFCAADVYLGSQIGWGMRFGTLPGNDVLSAYWDRIKTRPAMARGAVLDEALMKKD